MPRKVPLPATSTPSGTEPLVTVRRLHRRDLNRVWEFLKLVFRDVNRETVEYQRPLSKRRFLEVYEEEGIEQLLFEVKQGARHEVVGYAECAVEATGSDNWINPRYFEKRAMRPLFVEELAVHPEFQGRGIGVFVLDQLEQIPVCVRYRVHGADVCEMPATYRALEAVEPVYETLSGWQTTTRGVSRYEALP